MAKDSLEIRLRLRTFDEEMVERVAREMASWNGPVPSGVEGFKPYARRVLHAATLKTPYPEQED